MLTALAFIAISVLGFWIAATYDRRRHRLTNGHGLSGRLLARWLRRASDAQARTFYALVGVLALALALYSLPVG